MPHKPEYAQRLLRELDLPDHAERILESPKYWDPGFAEVYFDHCEEVLFHDPGAARRLAEIALRLAHSLPEGRGSLPRNQDLLVRACWINGSYWRKVGLPKYAESPYKKALGIKGISNSVRATLYLNLAVLRASQKRFNEAEQLVDRAEKIHQAEGDSKGVGHALSIRGYIYNESGRFADAVPQLGKALSTINPHLDPECGRFHYSATHNLGYAISQCPSPRALGDAQIQLHRARKTIGARRRSVPRYKLYWVEGKALVKLGSTKIGERRFTYAHKGLLELHAFSEAALVELDISVIYRDEGRWDELEELAAKSFERFQELSAGEEALAALSLWLRAVRKRNLEDEILVKVRSTLEEQASCLPPQGTVRRRRRL